MEKSDASPNGDKNCDPKEEKMENSLPVSSPRKIVLGVVDASNIKCTNLNRKRRWDQGPDSDDPGVGQPEKKPCLDHENSIDMKEYAEIELEGNPRLEADSVPKENDNSPRRENVESPPLKMSSETVEIVNSNHDSMVPIFKTHEIPDSLSRIGAEYTDDSEQNGENKETSNFSGRMDLNLENKVNINSTLDEEIISTSLKKISEGESDSSLKQGEKDSTDVESISLHNDNTLGGVVSKPSLQDSEINPEEQEYTPPFTEDKGKNLEIAQENDTESREVEEIDHVEGNDKNSDRECVKEVRNEDKPTKDLRLNIHEESYSHGENSRKDLLVGSVDLLSDSNQKGILEETETVCEKEAKCFEEVVSEENNSKSSEDPVSASSNPDAKEHVLLKTSDPQGLEKSGDSTTVETVTTRENTERNKNTLEDQSVRLTEDTPAKEEQTEKLVESSQNVDQNYINPEVISAEKTEVCKGESAVRDIDSKDVTSDNSSLQSALRVETRLVNLVSKEYDSPKDDSLDSDEAKSLVSENTTLSVKPEGMIVDQLNSGLSDDTNLLKGDALAVAQEAEDNLKNCASPRNKSSQEGEDKEGIVSKVEEGSELDSKAIVSDLKHEANFSEDRVLIEDESSQISDNILNESFDMSSESEGMPKEQEKTGESGIAQEVKSYDGVSSTTGSIFVSNKNILAMDGDYFIEDVKSCSEGFVEGEGKMDGIQKEKDVLLSAVSGEDRSIGKSECSLESNVINAELELVKNMEEEPAGNIEPLSDNIPGMAVNNKIVEISSDPEDSDETEIIQSESVDILEQNSINMSSADNVDPAVMEIIFGIQSKPVTVTGSDEYSADESSGKVMRSNSVESSDRNDIIKDPVLGAAEDVKEPDEPITNELLGGGSITSQALECLQVGSGEGKMLGENPDKVELISDISTEVHIEQGEGGVGDIIQTNEGVSDDKPIEASFPLRETEISEIENVDISPSRLESEIIEENVENDSALGEIESVKKIVLSDTSDLFEINKESESTFSPLLEKDITESEIKVESHEFNLDTTEIVTVDPTKPLEEDPIIFSDEIKEVALNLEDDGINTIVVDPEQDTESQKEEAQSPEVIEEVFEVEVSNKMEVKEEEVVEVDSKKDEPMEITIEENAIEEVTLVSKKEPVADIQEDVKVVNMEPSPKSAPEKMVTSCILSALLGERNNGAIKEGPSSSSNQQISIEIPDATKKQSKISPLKIKFPANRVNETLKMRSPLGQESLRAAEPEKSRLLKALEGDLGRSKLDNVPLLTTVSKHFMPGGSSSGLRHEDPSPPSFMLQGKPPQTTESVPPKLEPITLRIFKDNLTVRTEGLDSPKRIRSPKLTPELKSQLSPHLKMSDVKDLSPKSKQLEFTLKIAKDAMTNIPKATMSPKSSVSPGGTTWKSSEFSRVDKIIKESLSPLGSGPASPDPKMNKITLKLPKDGGHPEIKSHSEPGSSQAVLSIQDPLKVEARAEEGPLEKKLKLSPEMKAPLDVSLSSPLVPQIKPEVINLTDDSPLVKETPPPPQPPVVKKRGRPRKVILPPTPVIEVESSDSSFDNTMFPIPLFDLTDDAVDAAGRPMRSCRGRTKPIVVKTRRPRGGGLRGAGRGAMGRGMKRQLEADMEALSAYELAELAKIEARREKLKADRIAKKEAKKAKVLAKKLKDEERRKRIAREKAEAQALAVFEEETRMSAPDSSRAHTPALGPGRVNLSGEYGEESQGSISNTPNAGHNKKGRMEIPIDPECKDVRVDQLAEYQWQGSELFMIQEQISLYLGVKSFKRKYPDLKRRPVEAEERTFLEESGLVPKSMCDLGLTAVSSAEVLDIMFHDFPDKYEEFRKHVREKQAKEASTKQKAFSLNLKRDEKFRIEPREQAIESAATWNANLNRERREDRRCALDLQTFSVHYPKSKHASMTRSTPKLGNYPAALIPGQYCDYYKGYTSAELMYYPVNTVLYGPMRPNERHLVPASEASQSDSDESSSSDDSSDTSSEGSDDACNEAEDKTKCKVCTGTKKNNKQGNAEVLIQCTQCNNSSHPTCQELTVDMVPHVKKYKWQCMDCKKCVQCQDPTNEDKMLFCDLCDRGYHIFCVGLQKVPEGRWHCAVCCKCTSCGVKDPGGADWQHEFKKGEKGTKTYVRTLCIACSKLWKKGKYCQLCFKCHTLKPEEETGLQQCNTCERWIHKECFLLRFGKANKISGNGFQCDFCQERVQTAINNSSNGGNIKRPLIKV